MTAKELKELKHDLQKLVDDNDLEDGDLTIEFGDATLTWGVIYLFDEEYEFSDINDAVENVIPELDEMLSSEDEDE